MTEPAVGKSYSDRMQSFVTDPDTNHLDIKYEPYLDLHQMDTILDTIDIIQTSLNAP